MAKRLFLKRISKRILVQQCRKKRFNTIFRQFECYISFVIFFSIFDFYFFLFFASFLSYFCCRDGSLLLNWKVSQIPKIPLNGRLNVIMRYREGSMQKNCLEKGYNLSSEHNSFPENHEHIGENASNLPCLKSWTLSRVAVSTSFPTTRSKELASSSYFNYINR